MNINEILRTYESIEANLEKLFSLWKKIKGFIPEHAAFFDPKENEYDDYCRAFNNILEQMPSIDNFNIEYRLFELNEIGQKRLNIQEYGDIDDRIRLDEELRQQEKELFNYKFLLNKKRKSLIKSHIRNIFNEIDNILLELLKIYPIGYDKITKEINNSRFDDLKENISTLNLLLGSIKRPNRWSYLTRHLSFGMVQDLHDININDWPSIKSDLEKLLNEKFDPIEINIKDLNDLNEESNNEKIISKLKWDQLSADDFERIIYNLISDSIDYENPQWLMNTNASDSGRDLSVVRIHNDKLAGAVRNRVIIQCKHWLKNSVNDKEIILAKEQIKSWEPPKIDIMIFVTSGKFTSSAVKYVEKNNSENNLKIELWADSHLETILSERPALVAEYGLR